MSPTASWSPVGSAPAALAAARDLFDPPMRAAVARLAPAVRDVAGYHFGWTDADGSVRASNSGKAVRPTLAVVSAQAVGAPAEVGVPGALAVEFVHNFSLLHDDVMDRDEERRHRPTAWTVFGNSAAILAGDALLALAFEALLDVAPERSRAAQRSLAAATQQLIVGQVDDLDFEQRLDVGVDECLQMAAGKTAALMACSASIGARLGAAGADVVQALEGFGYQLGLAFQLVDDLLGIWGATASTGKPVGADLRARKQSLPVVAAMSSGTSAGAELRKLYASAALRPDADDELVARAAALVDEAGGRAWTVDESRRRLAMAREALEAVDLEPVARDTLVQIADYVTARDH
ncbi:MAG: geranylgeranyl diphosphate synthase, type [Actinomycetota bacterium]|jgi:geranylgeranyl diphosphate synthase type I|nr:geranylgeranyl diphosphate synthase, type [Actinomycetota bacterium]